jgi:predicted flap endonuclease-1-like 5' DNA nuclease
MENIPCWLIPLIVGFICAILGYLLGRLFGKGEDPSNDLDLWKRKNASLQADLEACRSELKIIAAAVPVAASSSASISSSFANKAVDTTPSTVTVAPFDASAAKAAMGKTIKEDDLTIVEGIGPKIKELFHNFDIKTWTTLADTSVEKCQKVLNSGGKRFEIHRPKSWPLQAKLAAEGKWDELKKWQDEHDYGKE